MPNYYVSPQGSDTNAGTSEATAWKTLATSSRLKPGDVLTALPGTITGTFAPPSGTAAAPITFRAKEPGKTTVDGGIRVDGLAWVKVSKGWQVPFPQLAFNVYQRTFETDGKRANFNSRDWNQYGSNPQLDLHGTPAEFKWQGGQLRLNAIPDTPSAEPLYAAITEVAINLNGKSHVNVEGITTRGHKHAIATNGGTGIHLSGCRFTFCGSTAVWLVGLADASMVNCVLQGAGSWEGHYEDLAQVKSVANLRLEGLDLSYGGHSGILMLDGVPGRITLRSCYFHAMGGSLLTLKRSVNNLTVEDCWLAEAAKSTAVDAHKVPHAGIQLSGKGHQFKNCVFRDNGKDILASSDGNADSNPVCSDNLFDHCTFSGSEAGAVEGQEYAPAGRLERNTWNACVIKGNVELFYAGAGDHNSNKLVGSQIVGNTKGVVLQGSSSNPIPGAGSSLTSPPATGGGGGGGGGNGGGNGGGTPGKPVIARLVPSSGIPGIPVKAEGTNFGGEVLVPVPEGARRLTVGGTATVMQWTMPADVVTGEVRARNGTMLSESVLWTTTGGPPTNKPPVANAGGPYTGTVGVPVQFDGSGSHDPDGTIRNARWAFGDGASTEGDLLVPRHTYTAPGTFAVTLTVTDNQGATATATTTATISAAPAGDLRVSVALAATGNGATFTGSVIASGPLPAGSIITVVVTTPDGRSGNAKATIAEAPPGGDLPAEAREAIRLTNIERAKVGAAALRLAGDVPDKEPDMSHAANIPAVVRLAAAVTGPVVEQSKLMRAAGDYAKLCADTPWFDHTGPDGSSPGARMARAGWSGSAWGENLARGFSNAASVINAWMGSEGHRLNLLNSAFNQIGVGVVNGVWVMDLGG